MRYPEKWGGTDTGTRMYLLAIEELARGSLSLAASCTMQSLMGTYFIYRSGDDDIRQRFLVPGIKGEKVGTICITEPDAGSDLGSISTRATETKDGWVLDGAKTWITSAPVADFFTVFALSGKKELSVFLVERGTEGLTVGRTIEKMGLWASVTSEVSFDNCRVPLQNLLGERGKGRAYLTEILARIRLTTAALALGAGDAAIEEAVRYANERVQFGKPIGKYQALKVQLADRATELEAARHLITHAAAREDEGLPNMKHASMAKLFASESALKACDTAMRVLSSYGYAMEYPVQRYLRDVRFTLIGGGTSEILKLIIAKEIGL
jgi:butyryl-CoA dehydrogenase